MPPCRPHWGLLSLPLRRCAGLLPRPARQGRAERAGRRHSVCGAGEAVRPDPEGTGGCARCQATQGFVKDGEARVHGHSWGALHC